jgi:hypothetical protein
MRATYIYGAGDIRIINVPDLAIRLTKPGQQEMRES